MIGSAYFCARLQRHPNLALAVLLVVARPLACSSSESSGGQGVTGSGSNGVSNGAAGSSGAGVGGLEPIGGSNGAGGRAGTGGDAATGGNAAAGSDAGTGGAAGASGNGSGGSSAGVSGNGTVNVTLTDYRSRKWARWPIPNPPSLGLPHAMSYTQTEEGVLDSITGLVWQETTSSSTSTWSEALAYCEGLGEGFSLPTRIELTTIIDNAVSGAKVDKTIFDFGGSAGWTWASTPWVVNERKNLTGASALSWFVNFAVGDSNNSLSQTATSAYSRCVRVPATQELPQDHYEVSDDEVVDLYTGLTWQRAHSGDTPHLGYEDARSYCEGLGLGGHTWRLPSLNELASLVDDVPTGDVSPAIDHDAFPATAPDAQYWSQSPYGTSTSEHWTLNFEDGFTAHRTHETSGIVRCVR